MKRSLPSFARLFAYRFEIGEFAASAESGSYQAVLRSGTSSEIRAAFPPRMARQRSQSSCNPSQKSADMPTTRASLRAVSGVNDRFPRIISLSRGNETPSRTANSDCVIPRGLMNSSSNINLEASRNHFSWKLSLPKSNSSGSDVTDLGGEVEYEQAHWIFPLGAGFHPGSRACGGCLSGGREITGSEKSSIARGAMMSQPVFISQRPGCWCPLKSHR